MEKGEIIRGSYFGKYREIVFAVAFFLVFDLAVLVLNFYISFQISQDAIAINLAGRQRMLSQRMTKALLVAQSDARIGAPGTDAMAELTKTVTLFDATLTAFEKGGTVKGSDDRLVTLAAVTTPEAGEILQKADAIWRPYQMLLAPLLNGNSYLPEQLDAGVLYARQNNLALLTLMNRMTTQLERTASAKANLLRSVQTGGIVLALLNFGFILFKFLHRLGENDRKIEAAQKETAEILSTVGEGLFLLDADYRIGSQYSASLMRILGRRIEPGGDFRAVLREMVVHSVYVSACDYIGLLLGDRVKESLVTGLNPLMAVEVSMPAQIGSAARRFLTLQFNRVMQNGKISHLLVTVSDVTAQVELEQALGEARKKAKAEVEVMLELLNVNPEVLSQFLKDAERKLLDINDRLRNAEGPHDNRRVIDAIFRQVHTLKGEAAMLGLGMFENLAQSFEAMLAGLRDKGTVTGNDLMALPLPLDEMLQRITLVRELSARLAAYHDAFAPAADDDAFAEHLAALSQRIARDHGKEVQLVADLDRMGTLPAKTRSELKDITVQLVRNAIVHGIEPASERAVRAKTLAGNVYVGLKLSGEGEYELVLRDDGCGLVPNRIRAALISSGRYTGTQLADLDDRQIVMKIFELGFSTAATASRDAGHGVGMDVVKQKVQKLSATLRIATREDVFTQFSIRFAA